jgi:hypothetical protein
MKEFGSQQIKCCFDQFNNKCIFILFSQTVHLKTFKKKALLLRQNSKEKAIFLFVTKVYFNTKNNRPVLIMNSIYNKVFNNFVYKTVFIGKLAYSSVLIINLIILYFIRKTTMEKYA